MPASTKTIFIILSIHAILRWRPFHVVPTRDRGPSRISSEDFPRRLGVRLPSIQQFVCYHTGKCQAIGLRPSRSSFKSSLETQTEKVELPSQQNIQPSNANSTTTAVQHPPEAHLGLPTTSWLRPSSFDTPSCPYVGQ